MKHYFRAMRTAFSKKRKLKDGRRAIIERKGYGDNWRSAKRRVLERDGYKCVKCGGVRGVNVHHIRKIAWFVDRDGNVDYEAANDDSNLISLCRICHKVADGHAKRKGFAGL